MSRRRLILLGLAVISWPMPASAHLVSSGLGPVYDGIVHFALSPEELLAVAALALFAGRRGRADARLLLVALPAAWLTGGLLELNPGGRPESLAVASSLLAAGGLLAADLPVTRVLVGGLAVIEGLLFGGIDGRSSAGGPWPLALFGSAAAVFVVVTLLGATAASLRRFPAIIAVRVVGSWAAAFGLLLAGWVFRSNR